MKILTSRYELLVQKFDIRIKEFFLKSNLLNCFLKTNFFLVLILSLATIDHQNQIFKIKKSAICIDTLREA